MAEKILDVARLEKEVKRYCDLMQNLHKTNVSENKDFQRKYNGYYKMQRRSADFYRCYYEYLDRQKNNVGLTYEEVLRYIYEQTGRVEASFSSKLLASANPNMPIIDSRVFEFLGFGLPYYYEKNRIEKIISLYEKLVHWYQSEDSNGFLDKFNEILPNVEISDTKKIDFILWLSR